MNHMKKGLHKITAFLLAAMLMLSIAGCNTPTDTPDSDNGAISSAADGSTISLEEAYGQIVQGLVNQYGILNKEKQQDSWDLERSDITGLVEAKCFDLTGDGQDELFCVYKSPDGICMNVYEYDNGTANQVWDALAEWTGIFNLHICRTSNNEIYWIYGEMRQFITEAVTYKNGKYVSSLDFGEFTEDEWTYINSGGGGLSGEGQRYLEIHLQKLGINPNDDKDILLDVSATGIFDSVDENALISAWSLNVPSPKLSAQDALSKIPYYGDRSRCVMDKNMAQSYAEVLENQPKEAVKYGSTYKLKAYLADPAGDGMPILITTYDSDDIFGEIPTDDDNRTKFDIWTWDGVKATAYPYRDKAICKYVGDVKFAGSDIVISHGALSVMGSNGTLVYTVSDAQLTLKHESIDCYAYSSDGVTAKSDLFVFSDGRRVQSDDGSAKEVPVKDLIDDGWRDLGGNQYSTYIIDGKQVKYNEDNHSYDTNVQLHSDIDYNNQIFDCMAGELQTNGEWGNGADVATSLRAYADAAGKPSYSYDEVSYLFTDAQIQSLAAEIAKSLNGEIGEIYKLSDDLYYIVIYVNGEPCGGAVVKNIANGTGWRTISSGEDLMSESALQDAVNADQSVPNITIDYGRTENSTDYLQSVLNDVDGTVPNDAAKSDLVSYVEGCVSADSQTTVKAKKNCVTITDKTIAESVGNAVSSRDALNGVLSQNGVTLNKEITVILHIVCNKTDIGEPVQITLDSSILNALGEADAVLMMLGDSSHSVRVTADALRQAIAQYGCLVVVLHQTDNSTYSIGFADANGNTIDKLDDGLTFSVPASNALCTVQADYAGGTDNWGGQFDENNMTISFTTPYSGIYTVMEDTTTITDIDGLTADEQNAIRFMVSKGYFNVENNLFNPNGTLTRYDFSQALVKMFFALDKSLSCSFTDVTADNPYYPYVASGVAIRVIVGYSDGEFKGNQNVIREEVLALCSRTLREKKGYIEPDNPEDYLHFTDSADIQDWARNEIALDVREGLITEGGALKPSEEITRAQSAQILYKLFMLLNEVEPVTQKSRGAFSSIHISPAAGIGIAAVATIAFAAVIFFVLKRRKKTEDK